MRACGLVLLLVAGAFSAPQQAKEPKTPLVKEARQLAAPVVPSAPFLASQFGARVAAPVPSYFGGAYPAPYAYPNQRLGYYPGAPQAYYPSASPFYPGAQLVAPVKKTVYKAPQPLVAVAGAPAVAAPTPVLKGVPTPAQYSSEPFHAIVKQVQDDNFDGSFTSSYETDHGIIVESSGFLKNAGTPDEVQVIQGSYTYYSPEGLPITTTYIADENGFQVQGDHLPVPVALPQPIAKALEYQRSLPPSVEDLQEAAKP